LLHSTKRETWILVFSGILTVTVTLTIAYVANRPPRVTLTPPKKTLRSLDEVKRWLVDENGIDVRPYSTQHCSGERDERNISFLVVEPAGESVLAIVRGAIDPSLLAFIGTFTIGPVDDQGNFGRGQVEIVVAKSSDQFDAIRISETDGVNFGISTADIIERLQRYHREVGIDITKATCDSVGFRLLAMPKDLDAFAADLHEFCPEDSTVWEFKREILRDRTIFLWWD